MSHYCNGIPHCQSLTCEVPGGVKNITALTIDHINGGGCKHRKSLRNKDMYLYLKRLNFPEGYQILCMSCQFIKRIEKKECAK